MINYLPYNPYRIPEEEEDAENPYSAAVRQMSGASARTPPFVPSPVGGSASAPVSSEPDVYEDILRAKEAMRDYRLNRPLPTDPDVQPRTWEKGLAGALTGLGTYINMGGRTEVPRGALEAAAAIPERRYNEALSRWEKGAEPLAQDLEIAEARAKARAAKQEENRKATESKATIELRGAQTDQAKSEAEKNRRLPPVKPPEYKVLAPGGALIKEGDTEPSYVNPATPKPEGEPDTAGKLAWTIHSPKSTPAEREAARRALVDLQANSGKSDKQTQDERLAELYLKQQEGTLSRREQRELTAIENAKTLIAKQYGAGYKAMSTPEGGTVFVHPGLGQNVPAPAGTRPQYSASERAQVGDLDLMLGNLRKLMEIGNRNRDAIGCAAGRAADFERKTGANIPFIGPKRDQQSQKDVDELFRLSDDLADRLLRARSGAQINEQEYSRLAPLVPNPRYREDKFFNDLDSFERELQSVITRRSGAGPLIPNLRGTQENAPQAANTGTVKMKAPDGSVKDVPADQVDHFLKLGATKVQ